MAEEEGKQVEFELPPTFCLYKDGSVRRTERRPPLPPSPHNGVSFKELTLHPQLGLWARLYLPSPSPSPSSPVPPSRKLPLVLFFHGGAFLRGSPAESHHYCIELSKHASAIFISASYRLAPEHRLPAAFDDGFSTFQWLHSQALLQAEGNDEDLMDPWLMHADFSKFFIAGLSAGGSITHHLAIRVLNEPWSPKAWAPICIRGIIPIHPGFVRQVRTKEEEECAPDRFNWYMADKIAELAMPPGLGRDHPYMDPLLQFATGEVKHLPPRALVTVAEKDILRYMGLEYAEALQKAGCSVEVLMSHGVGHAFFHIYPHAHKEQEETFYQRVAKFISEK